MSRRRIAASIASRIPTSPGLTPLHSLCFFTPLVIFLALLGWATWEIRLVNPVAFGLFAGLMSVLLGLVTVDLLSRHWRGSLRTEGTAAKRLYPFYGMAR